jgi:hypothetical protein
MKKTYINPETSVQKMEVPNMMQLSKGQGTADKNGEVLSRRGWSWDDDEE